MTPGSRGIAGSTELERVAAGHLGLAPGATPAALRAAFLRGVSNAGYTPGPALRESFDALTGERLATGSWLAEEVIEIEESRLRAEVDAFASAFFKIAVPNREERWLDLRSACASYPPLVGRLDALKPGLRVDLKSATDRSPEVEHLAQLACELFVLRPKTRAIRRQAWLAGLGSGPKAGIAAWRRAARGLRWRHPEIAALVPQLVAPKALKPLRKRPVVRRAATSAPEPGTHWWYIGYVVVVVPILFGLFGTARNPTTPPSNISTASGHPSPSSLPASPVQPTLKPVLTPLQRDAFAAELAKLGLEPLPPNKLEAILASVLEARQRAANPQARRMMGTQQLARELYALGLRLDTLQVNQIHYRTFGLSIVDDGMRSADLPPALQTPRGDARP